MATHFANTFVHDAGWFVNDIIEFFGRCIIRHHLCGFLASSYAYTALDVLQLVVANDDKSHMIVDLEGLDVLLHSAVPAQRWCIFSAV